MGKKNVNQIQIKALSYFLGKLLGLLHCLLHNLRDCCRWFLRFAFFKFIDLMTVVGMVGIIRVKEIKLWIVDLILTDSCFKLWSIPVRYKMEMILRMYQLRISGGKMHR